MSNEAATGASNTQAEQSSEAPLGEGVTPGTNGEESSSTEGESQETTLGDKLYGESGEDQAGEGETENKETESDDDQTGEDDSSEGEAEGAPESYEDFNTPEGIEVDQEFTDSFKEIAKEMNLTQEQAQKVFDFGPKLMEAWQTRMQDQHKANVKEWVDSLRSDADIGGANLETSLKTANRALKQFGSPELSKLLTESGFAQHPAVIKAFHKIGQEISEDDFGGGGEAPATKSLADRLYK